MKKSFPVPLKKAFTAFWGLYLLLCTLFVFDLSAHNPITRVFFDAEHSAIKLLQYGIPMDHGRVKKGYWFETQFTQEELSLIQSLGYHTQSIDLPSSPKSISACPPEPTLQDPNGFGYGSMGGYFTWNEMLAQLDTLHARYPGIISAKMPVSDTISSVEGRPLYYVKISDNPLQNEPEPEVLFTALHHAREPGSLSQMIYFMYYLCENYSTDSMIKSLVDQTQLYFIPCVNPDGYIYNQTTNPQGGGMWRKNRRINGNGTFGIDLNRNYGYNWGYDDTGSSPQNNSDTYRGTSPFSEPETRAVRSFCLQHQFRIAINNHTYGNLLVYPWGYEASLYTPDSANFVHMAKLMTEENHYLFGTGDQTVGYVTNGDSDDWMYGEQTEKSKILSMTPEAGSDAFGFWPPQSEILPFCRSMCHMNLEVCKMMHHYISLTPIRKTSIFQQNFYAPFRLISAGTADSIQGTVTLIPLSQNIASVGPPKNYTNLMPWQEMNDSISIELQSGITYGEEIRFAFRTNNGMYAYDDTIRMTYAQMQNLSFDPCNALVNWQSATWGTESPGNNSPSCFSDSPGGNYPDNTEEILLLNQTFTPDSASGAWLTYDLTWNIETGYDYMVTEVSADNGGSWVPLCGKYTHPGNANQLQGQPILDGIQNQWVSEEMSLQDFLGQSLLIRFRLVSDPFISYDGIKIDNISIVRQNAWPTAIKESQPEKVWRIIPNPATESAKLYVSPELVNASVLRICNSDGRVVIEKQVSQSAIPLDTSELAAGLYVVLVTDSKGITTAGRLAVAGR